MFQYVTPEVIAAEVEMTRSATNKIIILLEGENDLLVYKKFFNLTIVEIITSYGKKNAIEAVNMLNKDNKIKGYISIVDADFDYLLKNNNIENVIKTDYHDIEITIIKSEAFSRICEEYCTSKVEKIKRSYSSIEYFLMERIYYLSILRFINSKYFNSLCFEDLDYNKFISKNNLDISPNKCLSTVFNNTINKLDDLINKSIGSKKQEYENKKKELPNINDINNKVNEYLNRPKYQLELITNGHDVIEAFSISLRKLFSSLEKKVADSKNLHKILRLAFDTEDFKRTSQYEKIRKWEKLNGQILSFE